ncbi:hypothetical protein [Nitrosomonas sp.]|uniref:hypothetical protein n=1 Tax=Nitrosomonas sp. TaxID=42353 RepID=UPI0035211C4A
MLPETPIGQAPTPPLSSNCARKARKVVVPQITQEKTCGFTVPLRIARIYGTNAINVSTIATPLKISL